MQDEPVQACPTPKPYFKAASYESDQQSYFTYRSIESLLFRSNEDLSTYRLRYEGVPHVVVLGEAAPQAAIGKQIEGFLASGAAATLPAHIIEVLAHRRAEAKRIGPWVEGHYRPGKPM
jgi:hypothetical protein